MSTTTTTRSTKSHNSVGFLTLLVVAARTSWKSTLAWVLGLVAMMFATTSAFASLYNSPEKLAGYERIATANEAMIAMNGNVVALDTIGGVTANEFGFVAAIGVPLMMIMIVNRHTRKNEESGRLDLLLAGVVGRNLPLFSALIWAVTAIAVTATGIGVALITAGADPVGTAAYCASLLMLGLVFAGISAVAAQLFVHSRSVIAAGIAALIAAFILRGISNFGPETIAWLSPLGWHDKTHHFGDVRWWVLALPAGAALLLIALAAKLNSLRDVGAAFFPSTPGKPVASPWLASPIGRVMNALRGTTTAWACGVAALMALYGTLAKVMVDAIKDNPDWAVFFGSGESLLDATMAMFLRMLAMLGAAFAIASVSMVRSEERVGRTEMLLATRESRPAWLATTLVPIVGSTLIVYAVGALALAIPAGIALADDDLMRRLLTASLVYLPVVLLFAALSVALYGVLPRLFIPIAWTAFAVCAVVSYLGPGIQLNSDFINALPFNLVGDVPGGDIRWGSVVSLVAATAVLTITGFVGFTKRDVPVG